MANTLRRILSFLRPYWILVFGGYLAMTASQIINITIPQFIRWIIDEGIGSNNLALLGWSVAGLLSLTLVKGIFTFLEGQWSETASQSVAYDLRNAIQRKITSLSFSFHDATETGELLTRSIQDVERIRFLTGRALLRLAEGSIMLVGVTLMLFWMHPQLASLTILMMPLLILQAYRFGRRYRPLSLRIQSQLAVLTTTVEQNLRGNRVVKAFAQDQPEIERFELENKSWFTLSQEGARLQAIHAPLLILIANLATVLIIWYGGRLVIADQLSLGELVAFTSYVGLLVEPVRRLGMIIPALTIASSSGERVFEILDETPDVEDSPNSKPLPDARGEIRFEKVSFGYGTPGGKRQKIVRVLKEIDFEARPGQIIALIGQTGSGKSTIISLVPRFYDPTSGKILIDGHDLRDITLHSLRTQIGIVMQETNLFAASIRQNISFGRQGEHPATEDEIIAAAKSAQAHEFIIKMPAGYDTHVGERGVTLSGGQKQRIAIARAILMDPRILILDDATASVDTQTEHLIQKAFQTLMQGRTTFVIAHRLSTIRRADLILVLDQGRIIARGAHEDLLRDCTLYRQIYDQQFKSQEIAGAVS